MDDQNKSDEQRRKDDDRSPMGAPVGARQRCPYCGSVSYELVAQAGRSMRKCTDCGTIYPAGSGV